MLVTFSARVKYSVVVMPATCETVVCQRASARTTAIAMVRVDVIIPLKALNLICVPITMYVERLAALREIASVNWDVTVTERRAQHPLENLQHFQQTNRQQPPLRQRLTVYQEVLGRQETARSVHLDFTRSELRLNACRVPKTPSPSWKEHRSAPLVRRALTPQETQLPACVRQWKLMSQSLEHSLPLMNAEKCARRRLVKKMPVTFKVESTNSVVAMPAT